jgi:predicted nucleic acid-binding protein
MAVVVDANLVAALGLPLPYGGLATELFSQWRKQGERLIAPVLMEYELTTIVRRGVASGQLPKERALAVLNQLQHSGVEVVAPTWDLHQQALFWSQRIGQSKAYDAQYLALALREGALFYTADRRLANAAQDAGLDWVKWIGDWIP